MKLIVIAITLVLVLGGASSLGQNHPMNSESAIKKLERDLEAARLKGDTVTLDRLIAEGYIEIDSRGLVTTKADLLKTARAMKTPPQGVSVGPEKTIDDLAIRFHGDTALVSGRVNIRYQFMEYQTSAPQTPTKDPAVVDQERFLRVYVKTGGSWRLVSQQHTFVAK